MSRSNLRMAGTLGLATVLLASLGVASSVALGQGPPTSPSTVSSSVSTTTTTGLGSKVLVCHRTHSKKKPFHTISVSPNAVKAHLAHGDTLGACVLASPVSGNQLTTGRGQGKGKGHSK
jgi:hypothetical protein